jgi:hypothetical protein
LTAFIIESMKLLQEDTAETARHILYTISQQLANNSVPAFSQIEYETPQYAVVVNGILFTSLSCSLVAALLAVLALQWVANYDMGLNTSSARKRALQRHTRWTGIEKWKMGEVIASLPLLIFVSLFLFFVGIADWLWHLNRAISAIVIGGLGIGCLVYMITNLISIIELEAPFRTPVSKGLAPLIRRVIIWMKLLFLNFPSEILRSDRMWRDIQWNQIHEIWNTVYGRVSVPPRIFAGCEELVVQGKDEVAMESLIWLANSIEITSTSRDLLLALIREVMELPPELLMQEEKINRAPWKPIFISLCGPYFGKKSIGEYTEEEARTVRDVCKAFSMVSREINDPQFLALLQSLVTDDPSTEIPVYLSRYRHFGGSPYYIQYAMNYACCLIPTIGASYLHFILLHMRQIWSIWSSEHRSILLTLAEGFLAASEHAYDLSNNPVIHLKSFYILFDLVSRQNEKENGGADRSTPDTLVDGYIKAVSQIKEEDKELGDKVHLSIQQQLLSHMAKLNPSMPSSSEEMSVYWIYYYVSRAIGHWYCLV